MTLLSRIILYAILAAWALTTAYIKGIDHQQIKDAEANTAYLAKVSHVGADVQKRLDASRASTDYQTEVIIRRVPYEVDKYIPVPGAATVSRPAYYLTVGSVRDWDCALFATCPTPGSHDAVTAADLALSPIGFDQAYTNAVLNFGKYKDCRDTVAGWQDWYREISKP